MKSIILNLLLIFFVALNLSAQTGGMAIYVDGVNDYMQSINNIDITGSEKRTVALWVKSAQLYSSVCCPTPFSWGTQNTSQGFGNFISHGDWYFWGYWDDLNTYVTSNLEWNHHCITYDSTAVVYYLNGNIIGIQLKNLNTANSRLFIGDGFDHRSDTPFNGWIDEVRIWDRLLSQEEIRNIIYRKLFANEISDTNLVCYWTFNEGSGSQIIDSSLKLNNGIMVNMDTTSAWINSTIPFASVITENQNELSAIWSGADSNYSSILSLQDTLISGPNAVVFGHNNGNLNFDTTDVPIQFGLDFRLKRFWKMETSINLTGNVIIDISQFDTLDFYDYKLLVDSDGTFFDADTFHGIHDTTSSKFIVRNHNYSSGFYYTLAANNISTSLDSDLHNGLNITYKLNQNYPNPFNPSTTIEFSIPKSEFVTLKIYNLLGQEVATLVSDKLAPNNYKYVWNATNYSSGIYFYKINTGKFLQIKKMILLR